MSQIEMNAAGEVVVRNDEQVQMMAMLDSLKDACHMAKTEAFIDAGDNESLYSSFRRVDWTELECVRAERWLDDTGAVGWRCYIAGPDKGNKKLQVVLRDKLLNAGWDGVEVVPA